VYLLKPPFVYPNKALSSETPDTFAIALFADRSAPW